MSWGFTALDGLPDLGESAGHAPPQWPAMDRPTAVHRTTGAGLRRGAPCLPGPALGGARGACPSPAEGDLTRYEAELLDALVDRRDAAIRLRQVLADDLAQFEDAGRRPSGPVVPSTCSTSSIGGAARRTVTDAVAEFECARHRFRLALVAVGVDNGMSGADIGAALAFSRQLASRYLQEARGKWPELREPATRRGRRG